jgi:hypothetical protein
MKAFPNILKVGLRPTVSSRLKLMTISGFVQQGLCIRPGHPLLAPEGLKATGSAALHQGDGASRQGK